MCYNSLMSSIAYTIGDSLYLNITNRCTNQCPFCVRTKNRTFNQEHNLWLDKEPTVEEIMAAIGDPTRYKQIVFCGYGEPLIKLDIVKEVAKRIKSLCPTIRIDTNGHANLFWGRNILPELEGLIDFISISLNADNPETYKRICQPAYENAYPWVIEFIKEAKKYIPKVEATIVDLPIVNKESCRKIAEDLGVSFRVRPYYEVKYVR